MPALAVKPKLASGQKTSFDADRIIDVASLVADLPQERDAANDELASDQNVYSYVNNNPLSFTDPSGHGLRKWAKRVVKKYGRTVVAVAAAVVTAGAATPYLTSAFASGFTAAGVTVGTAANIAAGFSVAMGYAAGGYVGGAIGGGILCGSDCARPGAQAGAWSGGLFAGANIGIGAYGMNPNGFGAITARSTAGGLSSEAQGGSFNEAFRLNYLTGTAAWSYEKIVNFGATWRSGGQVVEKGRYTPPVAGANNFGIQWTDGPPNKLEQFLWEGGPLSRLANAIPGVNAIAGMHDVFQVRADLIGDNLLRNIVNLPGVPVAALMTTPALLDPFVPYAYLSDIKQ